MKLKIQVTRQHIKDAMFCGTTGSTTNTGTNCAIAVAVRDIFPLAWVANSCIFPLSGKRCDESGEIDMPSSAMDFITKFDAMSENPGSRLQLPELTFEVDIPDSVIDRIDISAVERSETLELLEA